MERPLWDRLYRAISVVPHDESPRARHTDRAIVATFLWAALHDRPTCWACRPANWPDDLRPAALPSQPTMSRRLRASGVVALLNALARHFGSSTPADWVKFLDAKPLPVGGWSKDPDAQLGRGAGGWIRGYKLYAIWGAAPVPLAFEVLPAGRPEPVVARVLTRRLAGEGYLVGDSAYDSNPLHRVAAGRGHQLVAPAKKRGRGLGHGRQEPQRLHALEMLGRPYGKALGVARLAIERQFGQLTAFGGGLGPLPAWVRRPWRVRRWVQAKILINAARIEHNRHQLTA